MTPEIKTPAAPNGDSEASQGPEVRGGSLAAPGWARKRRPASLVRFQGQYQTPETLTRSLRDAAAAERVRPQGAGTALRAPIEAADPTGPGSCSNSGNISPLASHPVSAFGAQWVVDGETGECLPLPCRSLGTTAPSAPHKSLSGAHKKTAQALAWNVAHLGKKYGADRLGFLTLTFADHVTCAREASRRFHSLATHVLKKRYLDYIRVLERQKNGRIHYHLLVVLDDDIRTGFDFSAIAQCDYATAGKRIRLEWAFWRKTAPLYRFGRTELMPVKSNSDALAQYVGKYIGKHFGSRIEEDKGVRLVSYSGGARMATSRFTPIGYQQDRQWRAKLLTFVRQLQHAQVSSDAFGGKSNRAGYLRIESLSDLTAHLGKNWAFHWREYIFNLPPSDLSVPF